MSEIGVHRTVEPGSLVFQKDDPYRGPYVILEGTVKVYRSAHSGRQIVLHLTRQGDVLALEPLFEMPARQRYLATAEAVTRCQLLLLPAEPLCERLSTHPELQQVMLTCLTSQLRALTDQLERITLYSVSSRLAHYLVTHAISNPDASRTATVPVVHLDVPKAALAAHLGTVPETLSRSLHSLAEQGLISAEGTTFHLINVKGLRLLAQGWDMAHNGSG